MIVTLIKIVEVLFLIGVAGCLLTIPIAGWGYFSVLFEKDVEPVPQPGVGAEAMSRSTAETQAKGAD